MEEIILGLVMKDEIVGFFDDLAQPERSKLFERLAIENQFGYQKTEPFEEQTFELQGFDLFKKKRWAGFFKRVLDGKEEKPVCDTRIYDYITNTDLESKKTTVFEYDCLKLNCPPFKIKPKGRLKKMKEAFISRPKIFENELDFHSKYEIIAPRQEDLEFYLTPSFFDLLLNRKGLTIEVGANYLLMYYNKKLVKPHKILKDYNFGLDLLENLLSDKTNEFV